MRNPLSPCHKADKPSNENDNNYQYHLKNAITNMTLDNVMICFPKNREGSRALNGEVSFSYYLRVDGRECEGARTRELDSNIRRPGIINDNSLIPFQAMR
ncbi:hypothetical protein D1V04_15660 [Salmonella enterica]|nr:hypothetical protein [Salmonella enterica]